MPASQDQPTYRLKIVPCSAGWPSPHCLARCRQQPATGFPDMIGALVGTVLKRLCMFGLSSNMTGASWLTRVLSRPSRSYGE